MRRLLTTLLLFLPLLGCRGAAHTQATTTSGEGAEAETPSSSNNAMGPPDAMVRADQDCPDGEIVYTGGIGTSDQVVVRELTACGIVATYEWSAEGTWRRTDSP